MYIIVAKVGGVLKRIKSFEIPSSSYMCAETLRQCAIDAIALSEDAVEFLIQSQDLEKFDKLLALVKELGKEVMNSGGK